MGQTLKYSEMCNSFENTNYNKESLNHFAPCNPYILGDSQGGLNQFPGFGLWLAISENDN